MKGWVDLGVGYISRWLTCPQTVTHPSGNHLIITPPKVKQQPRNHKSNVLSVSLPRQNMFSVTKMADFLYQSTGFVHSNMVFCLLVKCYNFWNSMSFIMSRINSPSLIIWSRSDSQPVCCSAFNDQVSYFTDYIHWFHWSVKPHPQSLAKFINCVPSS